jgi:AraC-like DNA-binding protein
MQTTVSTVTRTRYITAFDADEHAAVFSGMDMDVVRTGRGVGPNTTRVFASDDVTFVSSHIRFPLLSKTTTEEDRVMIAAISSAPPGNRWCGMDLEPGTVLLYGPGTEHTATSQPGLEYAFVSFRLQALEETADRLHLKLIPPAKGLVRALAPTPEVRSLTATLGIGNDQGTSIEPALDNRLDIFHSAVAAFTAESSVRVVGTGARIDSRHIVHVCIEYAEAIERVPTLTEMCLVAHVSERRLRDAFTNLFGMPPIRYFRFRSLAHARRILTDAEPAGQTVSGIASNLGFLNFGRFARQYEATYSELPSETLRNTQ